MAAFWFTLRMSFFVGLTVFGHLSFAAIDEAKWAKFQALELSDRPQIIVQSLNEMNAQILARAAGHPFSAHQFLGYSGASYFEMDRYNKEFSRRAVELNKRTQRQLGPSALTVFVLGASVDGFGVGYEILRDLIASGKITNVLVTGMASDEAISYHLEGLEKGWGHVISPLQTITYFKSTYVDDQGNRSWELKTSAGAESDTPKILKDLSHQPNAGFMTFNVYGGGFQAFNETLEMILESRNRPHKIEILLDTGYRPGKPKKDTGYRAADMLAYVLFKNQYLLNGRIDVKIKQHGLVRKLDIRDFDISQAYRTIEGDLKIADARLAELREHVASPEIQGLINYYEVLKKLKQLPLLEIEKFRARSSAGLAEAREKLKSLSDLTSPFEQDSLMDRLDKCVGCIEDSAQIAKRFKKKNKCDVDLSTP